MDLINLLVANLGVSEAQAKGGAGLLFRLARDKLSPDQFQQVAEKVSGVDDMIAAAPAVEAGGMTGNLAGMMSSIGGDSMKIGALAGLVGGFDKLNIDAGMLGKFVSVVVGFVREQGGDSVGNLLDGVLSST